MNKGNHKYRRTTLAIYYGMRAFVLASALLFFAHGNWEAGVSTTVIFFLMLATSFFKKRYGIYLPFMLDFGIVALIFLTLFLGEVIRFYEYVPFWDKALHFQSGLLLGAVGYVAVYVLNESKHKGFDLNPGFLSVFAVAFSLSIGALWEIVEFAVDNLFMARWQNGLVDTMWDLVADMVGALIISIAGYFWMYRHKRLPFTPSLLMMFHRKRPEPEPRELLPQPVTVSDPLL